MPNSAPHNSRYIYTTNKLSTHVPYLDGLRGFAILWVIFHNTGMNGVNTSEGLFFQLSELVASSGWIGVQLFFVLSGFLITGILLDGKNRQAKLSHFYIRRCLRIFPLYYSFLVLVFVIVPIAGLLPIWLESSHNEQLWYWLYLINWTQPFADELAFGHFWSLAIEEQFYIFWPLLVVFFSQRTLAFICLGLIVSAFLARLFIIYSFPEVGIKVAYTFTIARWDALTLGGLLAIAVRNRNSFEIIDTWHIRALYFLVGSILIQVFINHEFAPVRGHWGAINQTLAALMSGILLFIAIVPTSGISSTIKPIFKTQILRMFGKYSYAMYIIHIPIKLIWFSSFALDPKLYHHWAHFGALLYNFIAVLLITILASFTTWQLIEKPFLNLKKFFSR